MLNHVILQGRLTREPELRQITDDATALNFSIAVDRDYVDRVSGERETDFVDCVAYRSTAEFIAKYFTKGSMIIVDGRLCVRNWRDKDGFKRRTTEIRVGQAYFGEAKRKEQTKPERAEDVPEWVAAADQLEELADELVGGADG